MTAVHPEPSGRHGFLLLDKKPGISSFNSLDGVKKTFSTQKAGHTGTLDRFASGLLLILVGRELKLASLFDSSVKEYEATVFFGAETNTLDPEGEIISRGNIPCREEVEAVLKNFRGNILQAPPAFSAIHVNGRRAHELAREGRAPEMKKRPVTIHELEILSWLPPLAVIGARVSAGTYIRSLARDIALAAGSCAHLSALKRTRLGPFCLEDAAADDEESIKKALRPLDLALFKELSLPFIFIGPEAEDGFMNGRSLEIVFSSRLDKIPAAGISLGAAGGITTAGVFREGGANELLGTIKYQSGKWVYGHVFRNN